MGSELPSLVRLRILVVAEDTPERLSVVMEEVNGDALQTPDMIKLPPDCSGLWRQVMSSEEEEGVRSRPVLFRILLGYALEEGFWAAYAPADEDHERALPLDVEALKRELSVQPAFETVMRLMVTEGLRQGMWAKSQEAAVRAMAEA